MTWQKQQEKAFKEVKRVVTMQPVLKFYSLDEEVTLQCDANEKGLGAKQATCSFRFKGSLQNRTKLYADRKRVPQHCIWL